MKRIEVSYPIDDFTFVDIFTCDTAIVQVQIGAMARIKMVNGRNDQDRPVDEVHYANVTKVIVLDLEMERLTGFPVLPTPEDRCQATWSDPSWVLHPSAHIVHWCARLDEHMQPCRCHCGATAPDEEAHHVTDEGQTDDPRP